LERDGGRQRRPDLLVGERGRGRPALAGRMSTLDEFSRAPVHERTRWELLPRFGKYLQRACTDFGDVAVVGWCWVVVRADGGADSMPYCSVGERG
jgi:hypothetical protein